jgi:hypothetical protein
MTGASALVNQGETITIYSLNSRTSETVAVCAGHCSVNDRGISNQGTNTQYKETGKIKCLVQREWYNRIYGLQ